MQTVTQSVEIVSYVLGLPRNRVGQVARALLNADMLPKSVGRDVKKIDGAGLLLILAATAMADKSVDAPKVAAEFAKLPLQLGEPDEAPMLLPDAFALAMNKSRGWKDTKIEFARTHAGYTATIETTIANDKMEASMMFPFWLEESWHGWSKTSFTISREGMEILRNLFARDDIEGMSFKLNTKDAE